ncbi:DUF58 domain-containing protein [Pseudomonas typographi]|uniref:DUF58 domain-containing protein n=1 Tax=Pseudomonas typographi TaxID=2715964 RepID=UPI001688C8AF|nr:DUF58 domain-containing protein [Pseudomonas typographi]
MAVARGAGAVRAALVARLQRWQDRRAPAAAEVQLDHSRVYIVPSRAGIAYAATLLLILLAAINYQNSMAYGLVFTLGSLIIVAILHTYRNLSGLRVGSDAPQAVFAGEQARFIVHLQSQGKAHYAIAVGWGVHTAHTTDVLPAQAQRLELALPTSARGWLAAPRLRLSTGFPLGLLRAWSWLRSGQRVLVYPCPLAGELPTQHASASTAELAGLQALGQGTEDFLGLKPYQPGDAWHRLNWKAWSRGGPLLVKQFGEARGQDLALDYLALEGGREQRLSLLCHWVLRLAEQQRPFAFSLPGLHLPADCGVAHREACLRALALFEGHR